MANTLLRPVLLLAIAGASSPRDGPTRLQAAVPQRPPLRVPTDGGGASAPAGSLRGNRERLNGSPLLVSELGSTGVQKDV